MMTIEDLHHYIEELNAYSDKYISNVYTDYRRNQPTEKGALVDLHDDDGRLDAIGLVRHVEWSDREWDWLIDVEINDGDGVHIETVSGMFVTRHVGFCARAL